MNLKTSQTVFVGPYLGLAARKRFKSEYNFFNVGLMKLPIDLPGTGFRNARLLSSIKMKKLIRNNSLIAAALRESSLLVVSSNGKKLKRLHPLPLPENRDAKEKYGQRKQAWRGFDSEKSSSNKTSDQRGGEENHNASEHHNDARTPDDEDGERVPKEKTGHRGRGQSGRQKYRVTNGFGQGTSSAIHAIEPSKPPPGPRMPDGTRGFTMGRGRTLSANSNES
ncbi:unnamed protein product [Prunus armeniaca]